MFLYIKLKKEKVEQNIKNGMKINKCDNGCDQKTEIWICLDCGSIRCSRYSTNQCSLKHFKETDHKLVASYSSDSIWCYSCDSDIDTLINLLSISDQNKAKSMISFNGKVKQMMECNSQKKNSISTNNKNTQHIQNTKGIPAQIFGLDNLGNTCFFNSILQCLNGTQPLVKYYMDLNKNDFSSKQAIQSLEIDTFQQDDGWQIVEQQNKTSQQYKQESYSNNVQKQFEKSINFQFQKFLLSARRQKDNQFDPSNLFQVIQKMYKYNYFFFFKSFGRFRGMAQQDAQELLRCLLDALSTGEEKFVRATSQILPKTEGKAKISQIDNIFGCYLCNYLECLICGSTSRTFDFCLDLTIQICKPKQIDVCTLRQQVVPQPLQELKQETISEQIENDGLQQQVSKHQKKRKNKNSKKGKKSKAKQNKKTQQQEESSNEEEHQQQFSLHESEEEKEIKLIEDSLQKRNFQDQQRQLGITIVEIDGREYREIPEIELSREKIPYFNHELETLYYLETNKEKNKNQTPVISLIDCLESFTEFEHLDMKTNYFKCEKCSALGIKSGRSLRKFFIYQSPQILTIVLKRFTNEKSKIFSKKNDFIQFTEEIDLADYILYQGKINDNGEEVIKRARNGQKYQLYGVVVHSGNLSNGHYIAYVKHDNSWFYFSDRQFKEVSINQVLACEAYILFYQKKL